MIRPRRDLERTSTEPAALHHLRQRRRRQEHADRPPALRIQAAVRRPARRARSRLQAGTARSGGELDFALLRRRPRRRARAGHHHRRRLPLLLHRRGASSSSPTRPGHEQYTRNMVTGASTADLAVILVDARKGVLTADPPPQLSSSRCSASGTSCWRSTRWTWSATRRTVFDAHRATTTALRRASSALDGVTLIPSRRVRRRQRRRAVGGTCPGTTARR